MVKIAETETLSRETLLDFYRQMVLIRRFEETAAEMYTRRKIGGFLHLYVGEEAVAVGAVGSLQPNDYIVSHYREHGHALARGLEPERVMAELYGKQTGVSHGKGGSMHLYDKTRAFLGGYAIVAGHLPIAVGLGFASAYLNEQRVCVAFFGDGAVAEGEFHESLNLAALWKSPVIFICENNLYGMGVPLARENAVTEIYRMADAYNITAEQVDGMDVLAVYDATRRAAEHARSGRGPYFLEALTYRYRGHSMADPELYREKEEVARWRERDPINALARRLIEQGSGADELKEIEQDVERVIEAAVRFADESPEPPPEALYEDVYAPAPDEVGRRQ
ncbi:MAG: pyruvate dehydrogenase (acetyl-transferring) E1 component subunit alpha [Dehalococcoidia bacterium]